MAGPPCEQRLSITRAGRYLLPGWGGAIVARRVRQGGAALPRLAALTLSARHGGERFRLAAGRPSRSLKHQYQAAGVPPWQRDGPLLFCEGVLVFVPGLGLDAGALAGAGEPQLALTWEPAR